MNVINARAAYQSLSSGKRFVGDLVQHFSSWESTFNQCTSITRKSLLKVGLSVCRNKVYLPWLVMSVLCTSHRFANTPDATFSAY